MVGFTSMACGLVNFPKQTKEASMAHPTGTAPSCAWAEEEAFSEGYVLTVFEGPVFAVGQGRAVDAGTDHGAKFASGIREQALKVCVAF